MPLYLGLMSGTSLDGVDAAVVGFEGEEEVPTAARSVAFRSVPYDPDFRARLEHVCASGTVEELCELNFELGRRLAGVVLSTLEDAGIEPGRVEAVGSHGQTAWHAPPGSAPGGDPADVPGRPGSTLQIGEPAVIAEEAGIPVVADFRVRDAAAGGHGAPLTPYFDRLLLSAEGARRGIQNLGGMGNLTALPVRGSGEAPAAFDTGPGTALLDAAADRLTDGRERMDRDGRRAAPGTVLGEALEEWLSDPFFESSPPRSTGRERFGPGRLEAWLERHGEASPEDLLATLTELTARSVADGLRWLDARPDELYLSGGGARNPELVRRIRKRVEPLPVRDLSELGWDPDAREAVAFALLARQHLLGLPVSLEWATGARGPRRLGKLVPA